MSTALVPHDLARSLSLFKLDEELQSLMERAQLEESGPCPGCDGKREIIISELGPLGELQSRTCPECAGKGTGVITPATRQALEAYFAASLEKVDRIAEYLKHFETLDRARKDEKKRLDERGRVAANNDARVRRMLQEFMDGRSITQIKGKLNTISLCNNSKATLKITEPEKVPVRFHRMAMAVTRSWWDRFVEWRTGDYRVGIADYLLDELSAQLTKMSAPEIDEAALRAALEAGEQIEGCSLQIEQHIRIR